MEHVVTLTFVVQAAAGIVLLVGWWRHGRHAAAPVITHVMVGLVALTVWVVFTVTGAVLWGWAALVALTVGNAIGDGFLLVGRSRRLTGERSGFFRDYGTAIAAVFRGRFPGPVTFHTLFGGVVYFTCLGVCIGATVAAAG